MTTRSLAPRPVVRRPVVRWLVVSVLALLGAWLLTPAAVPIYDGIGNPDEPYRFVGSGGKAPTGAQVVLQVVKGANAAGYANSKESGPQISIYFPSGALRVPSGASSVTVTAQPVAPTGQAPGGGTFASNIYRLTATAGGQDVAIGGTGNQAPTLQMRAAKVEQTSPVFERSANGKWIPGTALRVGNDIYQTQMQALGDWALVWPKATAAGSSGGRSSVFTSWLFILGVALIAVALLIGSIRAVRLRQVAR